MDINGGKLIVEGGLSQHDGTMYINGGTLDIKGNYIISNGDNPCSAVLKMDNDNDIVNIGGDFLYNTYHLYDPYYEYRYLSKGTINLKGNFTQAINKGSGFTGYSNNFYSSGSNIFILSGNDVQTVHFDSTESRFGNVKLQNQNVEFLTPVKFNGWKLSQDTVINCDLSTDLGNINLNGYTLTIKGDLDLIGDGKLDINGGKLIVEGGLSQHDGTMYLNGGTLDIKGNYIISNGDNPCSAVLKMDNDNDIVNIGGDFFYSTYGESYLSKGTINLKGNFTQAINKGSGFTGSSRNFYCGGSNVFILSGNDVQTVHFDSTDSKFNILKLTKDKTTGYVFEPDNCWNVLYLETNISAVSIFFSRRENKTVWFYADFRKGCWNQ